MKPYHPAGLCFDLLYGSVDDAGQTAPVQDGADGATAGTNVGTEGATGATAGTNAGYEASGIALGASSSSKKRSSGKLKVVNKRPKGKC